MAVQEEKSINRKQIRSQTKPEGNTSATYIRGKQRNKSNTELLH